MNTSNFWEHFVERTEAYFSTVPSKIPMQESVKRRYATKLGGSLVSLLCSFSQQAILTRAFGPAGFGHVMFLQNHFESLANLLDLGASSAFATRVAQKPSRYRVLAHLFFVHFAMVAVLGALYVGLGVGVQGWGGKLWPEVPLELIFPALFFAVLSIVATRSVAFGDATGIALGIEVPRVLRAVAVVGLLGSLWFLESLTPRVYFLLAGLSFGVFACFAFLATRRALEGDVARSGLVVDAVDPSLRKEEVRGIVRYVAPLAGYALASSLLGLAERWVLQAAGGSVQQGHFALSQQLASVCFFLTAPLSGIFHREAAKSAAGNDLETLKSTYLKSTRLLYGVTALVCGFAFVHSEDIIQVVGGASFQGAKWAVALMFLYPLQQIYGQMSSLGFFAMGRTKDYFYIGAASSVAGGIMTYILVGSSSWIVPGFDLGAVGYAVRMLAGQAVLVVLLNATLARRLGFSFSRQCAWDVVGAAFPILMAFTVHQFLAFQFGSFINHTMVGRLSFLGASGLLYFSASLVSVWFGPDLLGYSELRSTLKSAVSSLARRMFGR